MKKPCMCNQVDYLREADFYGDGDYFGEDNYFDEMDLDYDMGLDTEFDTQMDVYRDMDLATEMGINYNNSNVNLDHIDKMLHTLGHMLEEVITKEERLINIINNLNRNKKRKK